MAATNINRVVLTGNLTSDPELRSLPSGTSVCKLRVACNTRRKDGPTGEWVDKPNYFDVTVPPLLVIRRSASASTLARCSSSAAVSSRIMRSYVGAAAAMTSSPGRRRPL